MDENSFPLARDLWAGRRALIGMRRLEAAPLDETRRLISGRSSRGMVVDEDMVGFMSGLPPLMHGDIGSLDLFYIKARVEQF